MGRQFSAFQHLAVNGGAVSSGRPAATASKHPTNPWIPATQGFSIRPATHVTTRRKANILLVNPVHLLTLRITFYSQGSIAKFRAHCLTTLFGAHTKLLNSHQRSGVPVMVVSDLWTSRLRLPSQLFWCQLVQVQSLGIVKALRSGNWSWGTPRPAYIVAQGSVCLDIRPSVSHRTSCLRP